MVDVCKPTIMETGMETLKIEEKTGLEHMCEKLMAVFAEDRVNIDEVTKIMETYKSTRADWKKYAIFDEHKYTRNLVHEGNGKYNLMLLAWGPGQGSSIHDHADAHCFVKVLSGDLCETRFAWPEKSDDGNDDATAVTPMKPTLSTTVHENDVTYMSDALGLHRVENPSHSESACSLHLYVPAFGKCQMFDERTGIARSCQVTFWSRYGQRTPFKVEHKKHKHSKSEHKKKNKQLQIVSE